MDDSTMMDIVKPFLASTARHGLTIAAGYLAAKGVIPDAQTNAFVVSGMIVVGVGWSWVQKIALPQIAAYLATKTAKKTPEAPKV